MWTTGPGDVRMGRAWVSLMRRARRADRAKRALAHGRSSRPWKVATTGTGVDPGQHQARPLEVAVDEVELGLAVEDLAIVS